jgi:TonB family protein
MAAPVKYRNGLIGTVVFHGAVLFLLLYMAFTTPLPLPAEQGILVDFGDSDFGSGNNEPPANEPAAAEAQQPEATPQSSQEEQILTQTVEETVALPVKPVPKPKPSEKPEQPKENKPVEEPPKPERTVRQESLYRQPGRGSNAGASVSQGETGGQGNQGVTTGAPGVGVYGQGGDTGGGNSFDLAGRSVAGQLPRPEYRSQEYGKVVIEITVDKDGNVLTAEYRMQGSTTIDQTLVDAAKRAARQAKFSRKPDAPIQKGTITYVFKIEGE